MATSIQPWESAGLQPAIPGATENWYALQTYAKHEKAVAQRLQERRITTFLPLVNEVRRWSDRKKILQLPLFGCYVFAKTTPQTADRLRILQVDGVLRIVGNRGEGAPIPDEEIDSLRILVDQRLPWTSHPFLKVGQRVRVRTGALAGLEGILLSRAGDRTLVISIDAIQRSLAVKVEGYEVEAA